MQIGVLNSCRSTRWCLLIKKLNLDMLKLNWMDHSWSNRLSHDYAKGSAIIAFQLCMFINFSFITFVGIHTWKKVWTKRNVRIDQNNHIQTIERDPVSSRRLELLTLRFQLCIRIAATATCLSFKYFIIVPSFKY